eukprot:11826-Heterococcus_DN1.PRE.1
MKFLNKNAYIQTALFSTSFCKSSREAFYLIARNIARVGAVGVISEFVIMIMKLVICLATMGATYLGMREKCFIADEEMFSPAERYAQNDLKEWLDAHGKKTVGKTGLAVEQKQPRKKSVNGPITATTGTTR